MRLVFVNYTHPAHPHISAVRVRRFADELAARGNQVVLLTRTLREGDPSPDPASVPVALASHDWRRPFHLPCAPVIMPLLTAARGSGGVGGQPPSAAGKAASPSALFRRLRLAGAYAVHGGVFCDWVEGSRPFWPVLADCFKPEATWGTFGNTDALWIGRGIARLSGAAWCVDIKDNWNNYVPVPFRRVLGRRAARADAVTANSVFHGEKFKYWSGRPAIVVYSGYENTVQGPVGDVVGGYVCMGGSIYSDAHFLTVLEGLRRWWEAADPAVRTDFKFVYAGGDHARVRGLLEARPVPFPWEARPYMPQQDFARLGSRAALNVYIWAPHTFHHKAVDLLAFGRPVLVIPGEHPETFDIAGQAGGEIRTADSPEGVACELSRVMGCSDRSPHVPPRMDLFSWQAEAVKLERVLREAVRGRRSSGA